MPSDAGSLAALAGQVMLALALLLTMAGLLATLPRLLRVRRRALAFSVQLQAARAEALDGVERLAQRREESEQYLRPIRRLRRWIRHPLSVATMQSYRRKRRRRSL
ncbi:MAG: hypothetical protein DLM67_17035 [Candidatus Nephthysia bennettiae]|uniref:Uncharacterized protein n=1 Tax=Candidatus Nephthysia bennettiae TaxID=3127016 RepID=A0A934K8R9_9BACT|nr:hypothetical protein [Candidatus Dormibacteraeota bacterium]MBJ7612362.1 hypothetical protein [Candidatus Dormibacteraeota bacterium]PZR90900.1 MAG: hypothetical protein DLM67_17035 [Candidatus Dormibacteraeota bacterium]